MITITGEPKEIAALVVALQERRNNVEIRFDGKISDFLHEAEGDGK